MKFRWLLRNWFGRSMRSQRVVGLSERKGAIEAVQVKYERGVPRPEKRWAAPGTARWPGPEFDGDETVTTFPIQKAIVKPLTLPAGDPREIREMLRFQVPRILPLRPEEIVFDFEPIGRAADGSVRILLMVARKEDIRRHVESLSVAGREPDKIILDALAVLPLVKGLERKEGLSLVADIREERLMIGVFENDKLCWMRSVPRPSSVVDELARTLIEYGVDPKSNKNFTIHLAGEPELVQEVQQGIEREWNHPVELAAPASETLWNALGAAMTRRDGPGLIPEEDHARRVRQQRRSEGIGTLSLALLGVVFFAGSIGWGFQSKKGQLARLTASIAAIKPSIQELQVMEQRVGGLAGRATPANSFVTVLAEINRLAPGRIALQSVDFECGGPVVIHGSCFALSEAVQFVEKIQSSPLFSGVELRSSDVQRVREHDLVGFTIAGRVRGQESNG